MTKNTSTSKLCARCGERPARIHKSAAGNIVQSKYCSRECGKEAHAAGCAESRIRKASAVSPLAMFSLPNPGDFDWRDAQMNPLG